ncbi:MAG: tetratricopeptide repeat protein [Bacteroidota bacterium]
MRIFVSLWLIVLMIQVQAQSVPDMLKMADTLYKTNRFLDAVEFYEKISRIDKNNKMAKYRLGICYKETLQYDDAKRELLELGNTPDHEYQSRSLYYYANLLRFDKDFKTADSIYSYLIAIPDTDPNLIELSRKQREGCALALRQQRANRGFSIRPFDDINSKFHDFGAVVNPSNKNVVLASTRNRSGAQYEGNQYIGLLPDLLMFEQRRNGRFSSNSNAQKFDGLNSSWGEDPGLSHLMGRPFTFLPVKLKTDPDAGLWLVIWKMGNGHLRNH